MDHHYCSKKAYAVFALLAALFVTPAASAEHIYEQRMSEVRQLAQQMENDTRDVLYEAEHYSNHGNYSEENALRALRNLDYSASQFSRQVDSYYSTPLNTRSDFQRLSSDYNIARSSFYQLRVYSTMQYVFARMSSTMNELNYLYTTLSHGGGGYNGGHNGGGYDTCQRRDSYGNCLDHCRYVDVYGRCTDRPDHYNPRPQNPRPDHGGNCYRRDQYGNCIDNQGGYNGRPHGGNNTDPGTGHAGGGYQGGGNHGGNGRPNNGGPGRTCYGPPNDRKCYNNP